MYSNIFRDIHIDDRRMRKHLDDLIDKVVMDEVMIDIDVDVDVDVDNREPQEVPRVLPERDRPEVREPPSPERSDLDRFLHEYHGGGW
jgi:hypothetical protein